MKPLLQVTQLSVQFRTPYGVVRALSEASLTLERGEALVIVGESGSGKTVFAHALLCLLPLNTTVGGSICFDGVDLLRATPETLRRLRGRRLALIPQSPGAALNPVRRLGPLLLEAAQARGLSLSEAHQQLTGVLAKFDLEFGGISSLFPHQLSGGMQQRVVNALALVGAPDFVIADEPTSGLDADLVDATAQQLERIRAQGAALLVITHDLRLAERLVALPRARLALMYASYLVEIRNGMHFFTAPAHPYGKGLLGALPERGGTPIPGLPVELSALPPGCAFAPRCADRLARCQVEMPPVNLLPDQSGEVRCFLYAES